MGRTRIVTVEGALQALLDGQEDIRADIKSLRRLVMALSQREQEALNAVVSEISDLGDSVDAALEASQANDAAQNATITALQTLVTELQADDDADAALIASLQAVIADAEAAKTAHENDVVSVLNNITTALDAIDQRADAVTNPPTPTPTPTPDPAPTPEPTPGEPETPPAP